MRKILHYLSMAAAWDDRSSHRPFPSGPGVNEVRHRRSFRAAASALTTAQAPVQAFAPGAGAASYASVHTCAPSILRAFRGRGPGASSAFIAALALALASPGQGNAADSGSPPVLSAVLADFEDAEEMGRWELAPTLTPMRWELDTDRVRHGRASARLAVPSVSEGGVSTDETWKGRGWPAVHLTGEELPVRDWSPYRHLVFEAFNPARLQPVHLWIRLGNHPKLEQAVLQPGWQTLRVDVDHVSAIDELRFFFADPPRKVEINLDHVRLETGDLGDVRRLAGRAAGLIAGIEEEPRTRHVRSNLREIEGELDRIAGQWTQIAADGDEAAAGRWAGQVRGIRKRLARVVVRAKEDRFAVQAGETGWGYGWTHGMTKVFRDSRELPFAGEIGGTVRVELAANESEGVQLVLRYPAVPATYPLRDVRVAVSDLDGPDGNRIESGQVEVLPVGYVNTRPPPYHVEHEGWWPDPLLDFLDGFELDANVWQPVWLDVRTAPDQAPGLYSGAITVTAGSGGSGEALPPLEVPFEVEVWDFAVPVEHHFPLSLTYWPQSSGAFYFDDYADLEKMLKYIGGRLDESELTPRARHVAEVHRKSVDLVLAHRMFPDDIFRYRKAPPTEWVRLWHEHGARRFVLLAVQAYGNLPREEPYPAGRRKVLFEALAEGVPRFREAGLLDMGYMFTFDEVSENRFESIMDIHGEIKRLYPEIPLMTTAYDDSYGIDTGLDPYVDIWVPGINAYNQTTPGVAAARERGREIWWYITAGPDEPYPNVRIEDGAVEHRLLMGFMPYRAESDGFLYWCLNQWSETVNRGPLTNARGAGTGRYNGAGVIFYPGPDGPVASIRMKNMRDGLEDFEYLWLLEQAVEKVRSGELEVPEGWLERAGTALAIDDRLGSLTDYSRDPEDLLKERRGIATLLAEANR